MANVQGKPQGGTGRGKDHGQQPHGTNHQGMSPSAVHGSEEMRSRGRKHDRTRRGTKGGTGKKTN